MVQRSYPKHLRVGTGALLVGWPPRFSKCLSALILRCRNVGLFRYWTFSNLPLFFLAAPTIFVLCRSSVWAWRGGLERLNDGTTCPSTSVESDFRLGCLRRLAMPQAVLAVMILLSYHVQIITRLSSAYPLWYVWLWTRIRNLPRKGTTQDRSIEPRTIVRWMLIYAMVQGALFGSFLPPA